jgi:hypothetical protein
VEQLLGVPINYYAQIDFYAFEHFIDKIGGVVINVTQEIKIDPIGEGNTIVLQPGEHRLYGPEALAYARARTQKVETSTAPHASSGSHPGDPAAGFQAHRFPALLAEAPQIYQDLSSGIHTNMSFDEAIQLGLEPRMFRWKTSAWQPSPRRTRCYSPSHRWDPGYPQADHG